MFADNDILIFLLILLFIIYITLAITSNIKIEKDQKKIDNNFNQINDMNKCPKTAMYYSNFQVTYQAWTFGLAAMGYGSITLLLFLIILKYTNSVNISISWILCISLVSAIIIFIAVYKTQNCLLYRICGQKSCISPYFNL